jgi:hypothetical protein
MAALRVATFDLVRYFALLCVLALVDPVLIVESTMAASPPVPRGPARARPFLARRNEHAVAVHRLRLGHGRSNIRAQPWYVVPRSFAADVEIPRLTGHLSRSRTDRSQRQRLDEFSQAPVGFLPRQGRDRGAQAPPRHCRALRVEEWLGHRPWPLPAGRERRCPRSYSAGRARRSICRDSRESRFPSQGE